MADAAVGEPLDPTGAVAAPAEAPYPSRARGWWLISCFFLASVVSTLDRGVFGFVVDPVRQDLQISEVQVGLLQGFSFGIFYALAGLPLGLVADRLSRKWLIVAGITVWSLGTVAGGLAHDFTSMFATRLIVGLGEAALAPCAISMISDMFPPKFRGRPISVYLMGQAASGGLSIMLTSYILGAAPAGHFDAFGLGGLAPWRVVFIISGALGALAVAMMLTVREPVRRGVVIDAAKGLAGVKLSVAYLAQNYRVFVPFYLGIAVCALAIYGGGSWKPTFLLRAFNLRAQDVGAWMGPITLAASLAGPLIAGFVVDRIARSGSPTGKFVLLAVIPLLLLPAAFSVFAPTALTSVLIATVISFFYPMFGTTFITIIQELVPNNMRGFAVSLFGLFNTIIGASLGPLLIAMVTEDVFKDDAMIGPSIAIVMVPALVASSLILLIAYFNMKREAGRPTSALRLMQRQGAPD